MKLARTLAPEKLRDALNGNTGRDVRVFEVSEAPEEFHARFDAEGKTYCYRVFNERFVSPFWLRYAHHESRRLDVEAMRRAAALFVGEHDWTAFSATQSDVKTRVREVTRLDLTERESRRGRGRLIEIRVSAEGFLRYMVRSIAGALMAAGRGELSDEELRRAIGSGRRPHAITTAPPHGLTLEEVRY